MKYTVSSYYRDGGQIIGIIRKEEKSIVVEYHDGSRKILTAILDDKLNIISAVRANNLYMSMKGAYIIKNRHRYYLRDFEGIYKGRGIKNDS